MEQNQIDIINTISNEKELTRLLPLIKDIAIIEYDGTNIDASYAFASYLKSHEIDVAAVHRIILLGKPSIKKSANKDQLSILFRDAEIDVVNKLWYEVAPESLQVCNILVIHAGNSIGMTSNPKEHEYGLCFANYIRKTRVAYFVSLLQRGQRSLFDGPYDLRMNLRLNNFILDKKVEGKPRTVFCEDKTNYIMGCLETLVERDAFFQCFDEAEHGCEECNQCEQYGSRKQCPFAQHMVAKFYREGRFVPQNDRIAHQWEVMAARQGFKPACIQVADDLKAGTGCEKDIDAAFDIYLSQLSLTSSSNDEYCLNQILCIAEDSESIVKKRAIPYIASQAQNGNEEMIMQLSHYFQNETFGLPNDFIQQKEWIQQGAENGNLRFVLAIAEMYEKNKDWKEAYTWYKKYSEVAPEQLNAGKLEELEVMIITDGSSPQDIAICGENYLFGYFGTPRDLHLAYKCLECASNSDIPSAKGWLGYMYLNGLEVNADEDKAIELLTDAAKSDDLNSMNVLLNLSVNNLFYEGPDWSNVIESKIEKGILKELPYAYFLKGLYSSTHYIFPYNAETAFNNMKKAAELNMPRAQYELFKMYSKGIGCVENKQSANSWLKKSADNGYAEAEADYGIQLLENYSSQSTAFSYLKDAYDKGCCKACSRLAYCYMYGIGIPADKNLAVSLYLKAAEADDEIAQEYLCNQYFKGEAPFTKNFQLCAKWGEAAIEQGVKSVRFNTAYANSYIGNHDRAKELYLELSNEGNSAAMNNYACELNDYKEIAEWFQKAADHGDDYGMWNIAKFYRDGKGVDKDIEKAKEYLTKAAEKGCVGAMKDLAYMYRDGIEIEQNGWEAIKWLEKAINNDDVDAILSLAEIYSDGKVVPQNTELAIHYYKKAVEKGNNKASFRLGLLYECGLGVEKNMDKAVYWYRKAAIKNNESAQQRLRDLNINWIDVAGNA